MTKGADDQDAVLEDNMILIKLNMIRIKK